MFKRAIYFCYLMSLSYLVSCSGIGRRPYYDRNQGGYVNSGSGKTAKASETPKPTATGTLKEVADSWLGTPYAYGGESKSGTDCSGFTRQVYLAVYGLTLPRSSSAQFQKGSSIDQKNLKPGDLVFFSRWWSINHVGIFMGNGVFIHASTSSGVIYTELTDPYFAKHYAGAKRLN